MFEISKTVELLQSKLSEKKKDQMNENGSYLEYSNYNLNIHHVASTWAQNISGKSNAASIASTHTTALQVQRIGTHTHKYPFTHTRLHRLISTFTDILSSKDVFLGQCLLHTGESRNYEL